MRVPIACVVRNRVRCVAGLTSLLLGLLGPIGLSGGQAQTPSPPVVDGVVATPVEIAMSTVNDQVRCRPPRARLPARVPLELRVVNRSQAPLWFVAPKYFAAADHIESAGFVADVIQGGFIVAPESVARVLVRSPVSGEYYYSCFPLGGIPNPASSGFLIVVPPANPPGFAGG